ncbi:MAG: Rnf-Nqr domain containing protein [Oscillospiraceae bacterium]
MKLERIRKISKVRGYLSPLFSNNPVLIRGLAMVPVIVVSNTLRNAVAISIVIACMALPVHLITNFFGGKIPRWFRVPAYVLLLAALYRPPC